MLLSFSITNFRSFREEQTISMVASNKQTDHPEHLIPIPDDDGHWALPVAAIYGANGAGKSNLVKGLVYLQRLVNFGTEPKKPIARSPFILDESSPMQPTELSLQFVEGGFVYAYGFRINDRIVEAEWLSLLRNGKEISVYERITSSDGTVEIETGPVLNEDSWGDHSRVKALTQVGVLPNQLFLHAVGQNLQEQDQGRILAGALHWLAVRLQIVSASANFRMLAGVMARNTKFTEFAGDFLRKVSTGVDRLRVDSVPLDEEFIGRLDSSLREKLEEMTEGQTTSIPRPDGSEVTVEKSGGSKVLLRTLKAEHLTADNRHVALPFAEESDGTQRLTHLLPALHSLCQGYGLFVMDEIDRSLHPLLAKGFVRAFLEAGAKTGSQLIFTTHETAFLDLDLLRRDEIWFVQKKLPVGATELYSLAEYNVRTDLKIDKAYLQGRFEAVPPIESELPDWVQHILQDLKPCTSIPAVATP